MKAATQEFGMWRRVAGFPLVVMAVGLLAVIGPVVGAEVAAGWFEVGFLARSLLDCGAALLGYWVFVRGVQRRAVVELTGWTGVVEGGAGLVLGGVVFAAVMGSIWVAGGVEFAGWSVAPDLTYAAGIAVMAGVVEELALRGVVFAILERWLGSWVALALSAVLFGGLHLMNPGATVFAATAIAVEAGVMLGAAFMVTRRLFLAMGLHMGWNFVQAGVFGVAVSGVQVGGLLETYPTGAAWISGGEFGAEASVLAVLWCGVLGAGLIGTAIRRGHVLRASTYGHF